MKATVLHEPYASLMAVGMKTIETRSWLTKYRGDIAICAAKKSPRHALTTDATNELRARGISEISSGVVLCVVELYDCVPTWKLAGDARLDTEGDYGDYAVGRYGWLTRNLRRLPKHVPIKGLQRIFNIDDGSDVWRAITVQLSASV